jgi:DNA-binding response OmpR family regulator
VAKKILIIDDDPDFVEAMTIVLEANGYTVISATDGQQGYERANSDLPDLMLLDVMMTYDSEGFELARKLKNDTTTKQIPIIVITSISRAEDLPFGFESGDDWLPTKNILEKPVKPQELLSAIDDALK